MVISSINSGSRNSKLKPKRLNEEPSDSAEPLEIVSGYIGKRHSCKAVRTQNFMQGCLDSKLYKKEAAKIFSELLPTKLAFFTGPADLPDVLKYIVMCLPASDLLSLESTYTSTNNFMVKYELNLDWDL